MTPLPLSGRPTIGDSAHALVSVPDGALVVDDDGRSTYSGTSAEKQGALPQLQSQLTEDFSGRCSITNFAFHPVRLPAGQPMLF